MLPSSKACRAKSGTVHPALSFSGGNGLCRPTFSNGSKQHFSLPRNITMASGKSDLASSTVKLIVQGRKLPVTDAIKAYVEQKISHAIHKYQNTLMKVDVKLSARGGDTGTPGKRVQKVEVTIYTLRNGVLRVEDSEENLYASIDIVCDKINRKLSQMKEKAIVKGTWPGKAGPHVDLEEEVFQEYKAEVLSDSKAFEEAEALAAQFQVLNKQMPATVLRAKEISLEPMTVEEAIEAMENVGHQFFVFREMESDAIQVVYKRDVEGYGVILPTKKD